MLSSYRKILKTLNQFGNYIVDTKVYKLSTKLLLPQLDNAQNSSAKVNCQGSTLWPHYQYTLKYRSKVYVWILVWNHLIFRSTGQSSLFCSEQGFGYLGFLPLEPTKYEPLFWRVSLAIAKLGSATVGGVRCSPLVCFDNRWNSRENKPCSLYSSRFLVMNVGCKYLIAGNFWMVQIFMYFIWSFDIWN